MEGFKYLNKTETNKEEVSLEKKREMRRRFFVALIAAAGIAEKPHEIHAAEVEPSMNWSQGIYSLQHDVYTAPTETAVSYISKGENGEWVLPSSLERETASVTFSYEDIDLSGEGNRIDKACFFHTHPLEAGESVGYLTEDIVNDLKKQYESSESLSSINFPPSTTDVLSGHKNDWMESEDSIQKIQAVATPSGVWYMELDKDSESYRKITDMRLYLETLYSRINELSDKKSKKILSHLRPEWKKEDWFASIKPDVVHQHLLSVLISEPTDKEVKIIEKFLSDSELEQHRSYVEAGTLELLNRQQALWETKKTFVAFQTTDEGDVIPSEEKQYEILLDAYSEMGVKVRYVSYNDLENEPPCAGAFYNGADDEHRFLIGQETK